MKINLAMAAFLGWLASAQAQPTNSFPLWPEGAPGALGKEDKDIPTLTPYLPDPANATGAAIVICPGGGYGHLAPHEGADYARFLNESGIAGFVLKYRLGSDGYRHPAMLQDAARAVRTVRARTDEWKLDAKRIGIMGSSAGGHLASTLLTHFDAGKPDAADPIERQSSRPNLGILCYYHFNRPEEAAACFEESLRRQPEYHRARWMAARANARLGRTKKAREFLKFQMTASGPRLRENNRLVLDEDLMISYIALCLREGNASAAQNTAKELAEQFGDAGLKRLNAELKILGLDEMKP